MKGDVRWRALADNEGCTGQEARRSGVTAKDRLRPLNLRPLPICRISVREPTLPAGSATVAIAVALYGLAALAFRRQP